MKTFTFFAAIVAISAASASFADPSKEITKDYHEKITNDGTGAFTKANTEAFTGENDFGANIYYTPQNVEGGIPAGIPTGMPEGIPVGESGIIGIPTTTMPTNMPAAIPTIMPTNMPTAIPTIMPEISTVN